MNRLSEYGSRIRTDRSGVCKQQVGAFAVYAGGVCFLLQNLFEHLR